MSLFAIALLAVVAAPVPAEESFELPEFSLSLGETVIPIYCNRNDADIKSAEAAVTEVINEMVPLHQARFDGVLSEADNEKLFLLNLVKVNGEMTVAVRRYASYFCSHKEKIPKLEPAPSDAAPT